MTTIIASFIFLASTLSLTVLGIMAASQSMVIVGILGTIVAGLFLKASIRDYKNTRV